MSDLDRSTVVLAIRPTYVDRILDGSKTIEFRRRLLPAQVETILGWCTGPRGGVVFQAEIADEVMREAVKWVGAPGAGIEGDDLIRYAGGQWSKLAGIYLADVRAVQLHRLGWGRAPQSWRYAPGDWHDQIRALEAA